MMLGRRARAGFAAVLIAAGVATAADGAGAGPDDGPTRGRSVAPSDRVDGVKAPTSRLAQTDPELLARTDGAPVRVMIKLDYDSVATYTGGNGGLAATSPAETGRPLTGRSKAERDYSARIAAQENDVVGQLRRRVPQATIGRSLRVVYGGISATIPARAVEDVLAIDGVVAVQENTLNQPLTDSSPEFVNTGPVYSELGTTADAGAGVIYGNLDSGIWPEHPSFADLGNLGAPPGPARECSYGDNPLTPAIDVFACQNKLIGGAHFTDDYDAVEGDDPYAGTARDGDGHGTHTASTSAGNIVEGATVYGIDRGRVQGLAPGAWVMEYKVCGPGGCFSSDSAAAVGQAILDGVDVINYSISGGTQPFSDPVELAFLDAYAAGVFVSTSAGNEGPGASTANHLSPWVTTVGASTQQREFASTLTLTAGSDTFTADGATITDGAGPARVMLADDVPAYDGAADCGEVPEPGDFVVDGEPIIVACERGGQARVWKSYVASIGGAAGMVLYNPTLADNETDNHWVPTVHLADGTDFVAFMQAHAGVPVTGSFGAGAARDGQGDVMAAFSSRGPGGLFIKPDVTAPGVQILAGATPTPLAPDPVDGGSPPGELYQAIAGTSMSSPHVAGAALLARAVHPDWSPGQIRSALMTTAVTDVVKEDAVTPADPFDLGAGRIDVGASIYAPLTFDETPDRFAALGDDPVQAVHLNLPSINAPVMPGRLVTTRVATNTSGVRERFTVSASAPRGSKITVTPQRFTLRPGGSVTLTITIESSAPLGQQQFGRVQLRPATGRSLHLPVAFVHTQGSATLVQACSPQTIQRTGRSTCTVEAANNAFDDQVVDLDTFTPLQVARAEGATVVDGHHVAKHDVLLSAAQPGVPSVADGDLFGYLPLDLFGIEPIPVGDEEIVNFDLTGSLVQFAGQSWDRIGVDSNGYVVLGGGSAEDNNCCNIPPGADPSRPNNVLAPFWTDLDGTASEGIFVGFLNSETDEYLVVEHRVHVWGTDDLRIFQTWMGVSSEADDDDAEDITFAYGIPATDPAGQAFLVGAENVAGEGEMNAVLPTFDQRVTSTPFTPGGRTSYRVIVRGSTKGVHPVRTEMVADGVPGVTVVSSNIRVLQRPTKPSS